MRYRKKPIEVEAVRWWGPGVVGHGEAVAELNKLGIDCIPRFRETEYKPAGESKVATFDTDRPDAGLHLVTVDGNSVIVPSGHYVVIDAKGFPYPSDPEIFEANHEEVLV